MSRLRRWLVRRLKPKARYFPDTKVVIIAGSPPLPITYRQGVEAWGDDLDDWPIAVIDAP